MTNLINYLNKSVTAFHAINNLEEMLIENGFIKLTNGFNIEKGKAYFIVKNSSSLIAFKVPKDPKGFNIVATHSDSPSFKVKPNGSLSDSKYERLNTERYGGPILYSWFDKPLGVAGRVFVEENDQIVEKLVDLNKTIIIPSVAIHLTKSNEIKPNVAVDLVPLLGSKENFTNYLKTTLGSEILSFDLFLYNKEEALQGGINEEFIFGPRLDDLECVYSSFEALLKSNPKNINVCAVFNNEEVGSRSNNGADSTFLTDVLQQIANSLKLDYFKMQNNSFIVSSDNAHAVHPNHPELSDQTNKVFMNEGIVIKHQAGLSYTTDALSEAVFKKICKMAEVPYQDYTNRSDQIGGSTLGNISLSHLSIPSVDIGLAQLAMHSTYETAGMKDYSYMVKALNMFFNVEFKTENKTIIIK